MVSRVFPNQLAVRLEEHEEVAYWGDDEEGIPLADREAQFFKLGIEVALIELGKLPFTVTHDEDSGNEEGDAA